MTEIKRQNSQNPSADDEAISLRDVVNKIKYLFNYLKGKWIILVFMAILGGVGGYFYSKSTKATYTAETTFVLEEESGGSGMMGQLGGLAGLAGLDIGEAGGLFQGDNIIQLYKSRNMIEKALLVPQKLGGTGLLINRYISLKEDKAWKEINRNLNFLKDTLDRRRDSVVSIIVKDINANYLTVSRPDKKLSIISVKVEAKDEVFAKEFADNIVATVNTFYINTKTKKSLQNVRLLQRQTDSVYAVMSGALYVGASSVDATPNLNPARQILRVPMQRSQFNAETNRAILGELVKNLELSKMALRKETPLIQVIDRPVFPLNVTRVGLVKGLILGVVVGLGLTLIVLFLLLFIKDISKNA